MRAVIAGAGSVGRSIAEELLGNGHDVVLIDRNPKAIKMQLVPGAQWLLADACELARLREADLDTADVVIAATGDDKANLVLSFLAKTESGVPRTVARVNHPSNEWLFNESWGVDYAVSTPRMITALVEEAVIVGDLVRMFVFRQSGASLDEFTVPTASPFIGTAVSQIQWPTNSILVAICRDGRPIAPSDGDTLEANDELMFLTGAGDSDELRELLIAQGVPHHEAQIPAADDSAARHTPTPDSSEPSEESDDSSS